MIRRHAALFRFILLAADVVAALIAILIAASLRFGPDAAWEEAFQRSVPDARLTVALFVATWVGLLWARGLYRGRSRWRIASELREIVGAAFILLLITLSALFLLRLPDVSRLFLVILFPLLTAGAFAVRLLMRLTLLYLRNTGANVRYMVILGANRRARAFADLVESHTELGLVVIGHLRAGPEDNGAELGRPLLGDLDALADVLHNRIVDEVAICLPYAMEELIEQAARLCQQEGKAVRIPAAPAERILTLGRLESIDGIGVYSLLNGPDRALALLVKAGLDRAGAAILLLVLSPVLLLLAVLVRIDSGSPVLFRQRRVGLHGRPFTLLKFRSMHRDAETRLRELMDRNEVRGHAFKMNDDPRVTRLGRFLRRTSLDELPQLFNVLNGQMSLVGPRPPLPQEVAEYDVWHRRRLSMKPGMTGLWQIGARGTADFDHWVEKDLEYIDNWSLWLDIKIAARTIPAMLTGR
jgi:exopolysaccharide biosynthesis polyprenyl glycosylphosphotransferase